MVPGLGATHATRNGKVGTKQGKPTSPYSAGGPSKSRKQRLKSDSGKTARLMTQVRRTCFIENGSSGAMLLPDRVFRAGKQRKRPGFPREPESWPFHLSSAPPSAHVALWGCPDLGPVEREPILEHKDNLLTTVTRCALGRSKLSASGLCQCRHAQALRCLGEGVHTSSRGPRTVDSELTQSLPLISQCRPLVFAQWDRPCNPTYLPTYANVSVNFLKSRSAEFLLRAQNPATLVPRVAFQVGISRFRLDPARSPAVEELQKVPPIATERGKKISTPAAPLRKWLFEAQIGENEWLHGRFLTTLKSSVPSSPTRQLQKNESIFIRSTAAGAVYSGRGREDIFLWQKALDPLGARVKQNGVLQYRTSCGDVAIRGRCGEEEEVQQCALLFDRPAGENRLGSGSIGPAIALDASGRVAREADGTGLERKIYWKRVDWRARSDLATWEWDGIEAARGDAESARDEMEMEMKILLVRLAADSERGVERKPVPGGEVADGWMDVRRASSPNEIARFPGLMKAGHLHHQGSGAFQAEYMEDSLSKDEDAVTPTAPPSETFIQSAGVALGSAELKYPSRILGDRKLFPSGRTLMQGITTVY
ncbi:hypothetical protein DFH06DRAFT_1143084 [Mycena polygramma]|nr:hypothetical protein DFH06DRAFT_1143084 [Mycena polygramma]